MSEVVTDPVVDSNEPTPENVEDVENQDSNVASSGQGSAEASMKDAAADVIGQIEENLGQKPEGESEDDSDEEEELSAEDDKKKDEPKKYKLKVGGKEIEITSEDELIKRAQMGYSADEKWQEAAKIRKDMETLIYQLQNNPTAVLAELGHDVDNFAESHIQQKLLEMEKSPEQREREALQKELEDLKKQREQEVEQARQAEITRLQEQYAMQIEKEISDTLDSSQVLPKSPYVVKRIADSLMLAMNNGFHDVTVADVLPIVEQDIKQEIQGMFGAMPDELVEAIVGKDKLNSLRKKRVKRAKAAPKKDAVKPTGQAEMLENKLKEQSKPKEKVDMKKFFKGIGSF